jgi:hypothetical protein
MKPVVSAWVTGRVFFVSVNQVLVRLWACCQGGVVSTTAFFEAAKSDRYVRSPRGGRGGQRQQR